MSTQIEPLLTIADVDAMPDDGQRYEIIEGELFVSCANTGSKNIGCLIKPGAAWTFTF
jgi:hypothetical protein